MTQQQYPITPPYELLKQWLGEYFGGCIVNGELTAPELYIATKSSRWGYEQRGADIEDQLQKARNEMLEACCELLKQKGVPAWSLLRLHLRPKLVSLSESALTILDDAHRGDLGDNEMAIIRRALERLQEHEQQVEAQVNETSFIEPIIKRRTTDD